MKVRIIANKDGSIVSIFRPEDLKCSGEDPPSGSEIELLPGQNIEDIEIPDPIGETIFKDFSKKYRLERKKLVEILDK